MAQEVLDVLVVGSGPGGGIAAYSLCQQGLKVGLIEAGKRMVPGRDYNGHGSPHKEWEKRLAAGFKTPVSKVTDYQEKDHFTGVGDNPRHGLLKALGGRSLCWAGHTLRFGPGDFAQWPISYDEVAPYYARAERLMGVSGYRDGLWNLPDGEFLPGVPLRCSEKMLGKGVAKLRGKHREAAFVSIRKAIPTKAGAVPRATCHFCGHCMAGCEVDSKYTSANTPIPMALRTGRLSLFLQSTVTRIVMTKDGHRVEGVEIVKADGTREELRCRALVLACSTVETARLLLHQKLANSSGQIGRNLSSHFGLTVVGLFPQVRGRDASNDDGWDYYHSLLTGLYWKDKSKKFEGTYQVQCGAGVHPKKLAIKWAPGFGESLKAQLKDWNTIHAGMNMQGMLLISKNKYVDLDPVKKDANGVPLPRIHLHYDDSDLAMANDVIETCEETIRLAGGTVHASPGKATRENLVIDSNHWVGTARMGTDKRISVVDTECRSHDIPNLFLGDASVFPAYPEKNPTLTNIALSWRMAEKLAARARRGDL